MPGAGKKKTKSHKNSKENKNGDMLVNTGDIKQFDIGDIVSVVNNKKELKLKNISRPSSVDEEINPKVKQSLTRNQSSISTIYKEVSLPKFDDSLRSVDLDEAFLDARNNNSSQSKNYYDNSNETKIETKNKICSASSKTGHNSKEFKTTEDLVAEIVPLHIAVIKHPLQDSWTFWYHGNNENLTWKPNHYHLASVNTVEDFWQVFHHLEPASRIGANCDYSLFKKGICPDWEDFQNMPGGRWNVRGEAGQLDNWWTEILLILIGQQAKQHAGLVNGALVNKKNKADKLAIWLNDAGNVDGVMEIGRLLKSRLGLGSNTKITFTLHSEDRQTRKRFGGSPGKMYL